MPRGPTVYSLPAATVPKVPLETISSAQWNAAMNDIAATFNTIQPIEYGGTGVADNKPLANSFGIRDNTDLTKLGTFNAAGIPTATSLTYALPATSGLLALTSDLSRDLGRVRAATTANITISTALNSGDVIDGVTLADGDMVLVKNQTTQADNGVYVVGATPVRAPAFSTWTSFMASTFTVAEGTLNAVTSWASETPKTGTLGTTAITLRATSEMWEPIAKVSFSAVSSQAFTDLSPYAMLRISGYVIPATTGVTIRLRTSSTNGAPYNSGASDYTFQYDRGTAGVADAGSASNDSALLSPFTIGNSAGYMAVINATALAFNKAQAGYVLINGGGIDGAGGRGVGDVLNTINLTSPRNAFQVFASGGSNISGFLTLEGVRG